jgi:hypothetical protein
MINLLNPYLYSWLWFSKYGKMPWGERSHGLVGLCESYQDMLKITDKTKVIPFLKLITTNQIRPRAGCPCGSGQPYRKCHKKLVDKLLNSKTRGQIFHDYIRMEVALCRGY